MGHIIRQPLKEHLQFCIQIKHPKALFKMSPILITMMLAMAVVEGSYIQGNKGENSCPCGSHPIFDVEECRAAADQYGYEFDDKIKGLNETDDETDIPLCNYCTNCRNDKVHLSTGHGGGAYWMCKETLEAPYAQGLKGENACPSNCHPIFDPTQCEEAATKFGYEYDEKIKGANSDDETAIPLCNYCTSCKGPDRVHLSTGHAGGAYWMCSRNETGL